MRTDDEIWQEVVEAAERSLGAYTQPDASRSVIVGGIVLLCTLCVLSFTSFENRLLSGALIALSVGSVHYAYWDFRRWSYRRRLRTDFWAMRLKRRRQMIFTPPHPNID